jgi:hypothetical protein
MALGNGLNHNAAQEKYGTRHGFRLGVTAWMNDNMLHSMATCLGTDVALTKMMEQGQVSNVIRVFHADLPPPAEEVPLYSTSGWTVNLRANGGTRQHM